MEFLCLSSSISREILIREIGVILTGGLGNQLFQIAAGLGRTEETLMLYSKLGNPRRSYGRPDCFLFQLPNTVEEAREGKFDSISRKTAGFLLRKGIQPRGLERVVLVDKALGFIAKIVLQIFLGRRLRIFSSRDVGFDGETLGKENLLIGYFQSWRFPETRNAKELMMSMKPRMTNERLESLIEEATTVKPIVVHIRLGDYLKEAHFGIPSEAFYISALRKLEVERELRPWWIFTNDPMTMKAKFSQLLVPNTRIIDDHDLDSAQVMHLMRFGSAYVIANSSFSWWAAYLRHDQSAPVIAPKPWFKSMPEPTDLVPQTWDRMDSDWVR